MMHEYTLEAKSIQKFIKDGESKRLILDDVTLQLKPNQAIAVMGPSGSGKSTLLHILSGLMSPDQGVVYLEGEQLNSPLQGNVNQIRNEKIGFVFQAHHLMRDFTVLENVMIPMLLSGKSKRRAREKAKNLLLDLGLGTLHHQKKVKDLSGGEKQRVALLRAVINQPRIIFADEPTGNLDKEQAQLVCDFFQNIIQKLGCSLLLVTHDVDVASRLSSIYVLQNGQLRLQGNE